MNKYILFTDYGLTRHFLGDRVGVYCMYIMYNTYTHTYIHIYIHRLRRDISSMTFVTALTSTGYLKRIAHSHEYISIYI